MPGAMSHAAPARVAALRGRMDELALDAVVISRPAGMRYFAGFRLAPAELAGHSGTLFVTRDELRILADARYAEQAEYEAPDWELVRTSEALEVELTELFARDDVLRAGLEGEVMSHGTWSRIVAAAPGTELHDVDAEVAELRLVKEPAEIEAIASACALTDRCFTHLLDFVRSGMTELQVAWELERFFRVNGAEGLAFDSIVLAGARASLPHGRPGEATVETGNVLLIDFGCVVDGYRSDMTRTVFIGEPSDELRSLYTIVREAQQKALEAARPGVIGKAVDAAAREHIGQAGYANAFGHGVGHGIGLETHEAPLLRHSAEPLRAGMVFSVEPGIYLPGVTGIRIEDIVALTAGGPRPLTQSSREIIVI